ncbi:TRAP transporter small permease [Thermotoga sp. SG1]|uniref:TRAP transporter small permease n=1 Tax=Thermotoga sp. SG1 TaxID=126739 RepID=UPI000C783EAB|nr:TRAP transporter small permease [Thermotoga sp. SG1]PLV57409.1 C4-dicarboxylate ABC transporter [Thermotoga sp. SG1]
MKKLDQILLKFEKHSAKILLMAMIVLVFASGVARFLKHPINWAVDVSSFLFAWACFFAVDVAWRENKMMSVDILVRKFSERTQKIIRIVNYFIILAFVVYLIVWGFYLSYKTRYRTFVGIPNFSYTWVTLSVPVGALLLFRTTVLKLIEEFKGNKKEEK